MNSVTAFKQEEFFKIQDGIAPDCIVYIGRAAIDVREYGITIDAYNDEINKFTDNALIPSDLYIIILKKPKKDLPYFKDQVARETGYVRWSVLPDEVYIRFSIQQDDGTVWQPTREELLDRAATLFAEHERKEAAPKWIPVSTLPESGKHVLLFCAGEGVIKPSGKPKTFICTGFYTEKHTTECWCDDYDPKTTRGIDDYNETLYLSEGWYTEHEQFRGDTDYHFFSRNVIAWMPLPAIPE